MYSWLWMVIISGILLGFWDITKKQAFKKNSVVSVLAFYSIFCFIFVSFEFSNAVNLSGDKILVIFVKTFIIFLSWVLGFTAIKQLPISIVTPFDTVNPLFSIILGILILGESLGLLQGIGIVIMLVAYYFIGKVGSKEITNVFRNKYFYFMVVSALLSAVSATIDKIALRSINPGQMQFWFCLFISIFNVASLLYTKWKSEEKIPIRFDYNIPLMSLLLTISDRIYFTAVNIPSSQISVIMPLRKISIFISVIIGGLIFKEQNLRQKFWCICLLIVGIGLVFIAK
ncbi:DMT family transporter [Clostridium magnum]|uniref:EamA-like transporter family protein n=1 Tax=Clostridium magnum DSM 2767 TaxID=1121326 RepID=A0A161WJ78_9CLOT|nr:DMT family transporter [Clostridium magnum]KZL91765.1 EamA-like transporter family protein [Clostridium magnum DSM 2767]SHJ02535.1 Uncharacterized membrane protein [Clostridium magnum DSM 2767]